MSLAAKLHKKSNVHKFVVHKSQWELKDEATTIVIVVVEQKLVKSFIQRLLRINLRFKEIRFHDIP